MTEDLFNTKVFNYILSHINQYKKERDETSNPHRYIELLGVLEALTDLKDYLIYVIQEAENTDHDKKL